MVMLMWPMESYKVPRVSTTNENKSSLYRSGRSTSKFMLPSEFATGRPRVFDL